MADRNPRPLWAKTPRSLIFDAGWTLADHRVYELLDFRAGRRGWWRTTQAIIASDLSISERTVKRAVSRLRDGGLLETERHGNLDGEMTYRIVARLPHEVAIPLDAEGTPVSLPISSEGTSVSPGGDASVTSDGDAASYRSPQTSTTEKRDPFRKVVQRSWPPEERQAN